MEKASLELLYILYVYIHHIYTKNIDLVHFRLGAHVELSN